MPNASLESFKVSNLLGAVEIREIAEQLNLKPTKKLGQNFVVDANTCRKIVKLAVVQSTDIALEIGPGVGSLTLALLEKAIQVVAVEIDDRLANQLPITAANHGFDSKKLVVINQDAMQINKLPVEPTVLVANLPYNISVPVLLNMLQLFPSIDRGVVMVQSEVAHRLAAKPNSKEYGSPTAKVNWWADLELAGSVSRSIFWPIPNVDSSLVKFVRHKPIGNEQDRIATFSVIDKAFAKRRKMMRSAVSVLFNDAEESLIAAGVDPTLRGEALDIGKFYQIGQQLIKHNSTK
ncbi:MAG: 16S rRNA (adenine(1518)-N(6)/adenine(1519)-N(6))-dimethyltransferase RsmA [Actinobacteria bacterium]|nr:16S rRNA (adenine(1518)-N(6)/adenine(1519)-N(6))-dimethyltransferase RsmA [Actinomycetota bacterium]